MKSFYKIDLELEQRIIVKNDYVMCFPAKMPIVPGHVLIVPVREVKTFEELSNSEREALFDLMQNIKLALKNAFQATGFNHAWNQEKIAGQSVEHFHLHIIPRKEGDTGITNYEPRDFLYRSAPVESRKVSAEQELIDVSNLIRSYM